MFVSTQTNSDSGYQSRLSRVRPRVAYYKVLAILSLAGSHQRPLLLRARVDEEIYIRRSLEEEFLRVNWNTNVETSLSIAEPEMEPLAGAKILPCTTRDHDELSSARFWTNVLPELSLGVIYYLVLSYLISIPPHQPEQTRI